MYLIIFQRLLIEAAVDVLYWPLWWYSAGLARAGRWSLERLKRGSDRLAPGLWLKNILVPMYGQFDWQGRIISFVMRLAQVLGRGLALVVWLFVCLLLFVGWLIFPLVVIFGLIGI